MVIDGLPMVMSPTSCASVHTTAPLAILKVLQVQRVRVCL